jgi:hypothetical protein
LEAFKLSPSFARVDRGVSRRKKSARRMRVFLFDFMNNKN